MTYQLRGKANKWWKTWKKCRARDAVPVEWAEFQKTFQDQFIPKSVQDTKMSEFKTLRQGSRTMDEYDALFVKLSDFTPHMIPDEGGEDQEIRERP